MAKKKKNILKSLETSKISHNLIIKIILLMNKSVSCQKSF